nr:hypothetical protein [Microbacterium karelineae]
MATTTLMARVACSFSAMSATTARARAAPADPKTPCTKRSAMTSSMDPARADPNPAAA